MFERFKLAFAQLGTKWELFLQLIVAALLVGISWMAPDFIKVYFTSNADLITTGVVGAVYLAYQLLSKEGKNFFDVLINGNKAAPLVKEKNDQGSASTVFLFLVALVIVAAVVIVYLFHVDVVALYLAAAAVVGAFATSFLLKTKASRWVGVTIVKDADGESANINYKEWLNAYGREQIKMGGSIPKKVLPVFLNGSGSKTTGLYYDVDTNILYATDYCPLFLTPPESRKQKWDQIFASKNPLQLAIQKGWIDVNVLQIQIELVYGPARAQEILAKYNAGDASTVAYFQNNPDAQGFDDFLANLLAADAGKQMMQLEDVLVKYIGEKA